VSSPQVHQNLLFLKKIALGENGKTKIENMLSARKLFIACKRSMKSKDKELYDDKKSSTKRKVSGNRIKASILITEYLKKC
jgi:hypothetical protein